ncbi:unnamed protein product [Rhodiola kirilowii]
MVRSRPWCFAAGAGSDSAVQRDLIHCLYPLDWKVTHWIGKCTAFAALSLS